MILNSNVTSHDRGFEVGVTLNSNSPLTDETAGGFEVGSDSKL